MNFPLFCFWNQPLVSLYVVGHNPSCPWTASWLLLVFWYCVVRQVQLNHKIIKTLKLIIQQINSMSTENIFPLRWDIKRQQIATRHSQRSSNCQWKGSVFVCCWNPQGFANPIKHQRRQQQQVDWLVLTTLASTWFGVDVAVVFENQHGGVGKILRRRHGLLRYPLGGDRLPGLIARVRWIQTSRGTYYPRAPDANSSGQYFRQSPDRPTNQGCHSSYFNSPETSTGCRQMQIECNLRWNQSKTKQNKSYLKHCAENSEFEIFVMTFDEL